VLKKPLYLKNISHKNPSPQFVLIVILIYNIQLLYMSRADVKMFESFKTKNDPQKRLYEDVVELFLA